MTQIASGTPNSSSLVGLQVRDVDDLGDALGEHGGQPADGG
jgi:hypothetical protein